MWAHIVANWPWYVGGYSVIGLIVGGFYYAFADRADSTTAALVGVFWPIVALAHGGDALFIILLFS